MSNELSHFQRKTLDNAEIAQHQRRNQNLLLAANSVATLIHARQTEKLTRSVAHLGSEISKQARALQRIEGVQSEILDETRRQTRLLELSESQKKLERMSQDAVFRLGSQVSEIEALSSNLEKYFTASACISSVNAQNIKYENLPSIDDKERLRAAMQNLHSLSVGALENMSDAEISDLTRLDELRQQFGSIGELRKISKGARSSIQDICDLPSREIVARYELKPQVQRKVTYGRSIASILVGFGFVIWGAEMQGSEYGLLLLFVAAVLILGGVLGFAWRLLNGAFRVGRGLVDGSREQLQEKVAEKRAALIGEIEEQFARERSGLDLGVSGVISLDNFEKVSEVALRNIGIELQSLMKKYPSLSIKLE